MDGMVGVREGAGVRERVGSALPGVTVNKGGSVDAPCASSVGKIMGDIGVMDVGVFSGVSVVRAGSVATSTYRNGVLVGRGSTGTRVLFDIPNHKTTPIPTRERMPSEIGAMTSRSMEGFLSMGSSLLWNNPIPLMIWKRIPHNMLNLIPRPAGISLSTGSFTITKDTRIFAGPNEEVAAIVGSLAEYIAEATGHKIESGFADQPGNSIRLSLVDNSSLGEEGYELSITPDGIDLRAHQPAGLFYGTQTLRQLSGTPQDQTLSLPAVSIHDSPRFNWRGAMLDVARHFFGVEDIKRYIDLISHYKMNRLHLHLTDDQGWRIEIKSWSKLTGIGAQTQVNGGGGGFYTQEQFKEIVEYARSRYVTIVPEIDTPGHTNAALASYPELNQSEEAPPLYEGTEVGFSTLNINSEITYKFLEDVIRELAAISPAPYIHIGGDEAKSTPEDQYKYFIKRFQQIIFAHDKIPVGWAEIGDAELDPRTLAQHWQGAAYQNAKKQGCKIILSPGNKTYLDMKYDESTPIGLDWAGYISVKDSYDWDPGSTMDGLEESDVLGIEAPLWTETVLTMKDIEYMTFPRIVGIAELAWSSKGQNWEEYKQRLAKHGKYMRALNINYFNSPDVEWE
ncbi:MAG: beta-N-acetylhexosaminidase [Anaerolineales bacterium]|nr:MAG: beta-N-acetylhexosaminidase [Anaerolineales bacterium]